MHHTDNIPVCCSCGVREMKCHTKHPDNLDVYVWQFTAGVQSTVVNLQLSNLAWKQSLTKRICDASMKAINYKVGFQSCQAWTAVGLPPRYPQKNCTPFRTVGFQITSSTVVKTEFIIFCKNQWAIFTHCLRMIKMLRSSEWVSSVLRPHQHSIGYTGDGFYRSKDPTNAAWHEYRRHVTLYHDS